MKVVKKLIAAASLFLLLFAGCARDPKLAGRKSYERGLQYLQQQKFEEAAIEFGKAIQRDPRLFDAHYQLGLTALKLQRPQQAYRELSLAVELQPSSVPARASLADLLMTGGKLDDAREQLDAAQRLDSRNAEVLFEYGKLSLAKKDFSRAVEEFDKALESSPGNATFWSARGLADIGLKRYADAEKDFQRTIQISPESAEGYPNLTNLYLATGRTAQIEPLLLQAIQSYPRSRDLYLTLGDSYVRQHQPERAEQLFAQMKSRPQDFSDLNLYLGQFWMWRQQLPRAAQEFEAVLAKGPNLLAQKNLISADITMRRVDDAEKWNQGLLRKYPKDLDALAFQGALLCLKGDYAQAVLRLQDVLKKDANSQVANFYIGVAWMELGKTGEAKLAFLNCLRINSNFAPASLRLAELALRAGDWKTAELYSEEVLKTDSSSMDAALLLVQAGIFHGDLRRADTILADIQKAWNPPAEFFTVSAQVAEKKRDDKAAVADYEQALSRAEHPLPVLTQYVQFYLRQGHVVQAITRVQQWVATKPTQPEGYELLAQLYLRVPDYRGAEAASRKVIELNPKESYAHYLLGEALRLEGRTAEASNQYDEAIHGDAGQVSAYLAAGKLALDSGQSDRAEQYFNDALRRAPESSQAQLAVAGLKADRGKDLDQALGMAQSLKSRFPTSGAVADTLGWIYYQKGLYDMAVEQLKPAALELPNDAMVQLHLGLSYAKKGDRRKAIGSLERSLKLGIPSPSLAAMAQQTLNQLRNG